MVSVARAVLKGKLLRWGHTKGVRFPTKDAAKLEIPLGTDVKVTVEPVERHGLHEVLTLRGGVSASLDHDRILAEGWLKRRRR